MATNQNGVRELKKPRHSKTKDLMRAQTPEQVAQLSIDIEKMLTVDIKSDLRYYLKRYSKILGERLGMNEDDIINDVREQIWKALITWKPNGKANKKTYCLSIVSRRFYTLLKKTDAEKNNMVLYYADVFSSVEANADTEGAHQDSGEVLMMRREESLKDLQTLNELEQVVYPALLQGCSVSEIIKRLSATMGLTVDRVTVVGVIKAIDTRIAERRQNSEKVWK